MQFVKQSHISTGRNWSPQGFAVAHIVTIVCVEASCECWCVLGNLATLTCVGECYFGVNFHCVGIANIWPLPRVAKTHAANECVLSRNALLSVCFYRRADWEWCHWDDLCDLTFLKRFLCNQKSRTTPAKDVVDRLTWWAGDGVVHHLSPPIMWPASPPSEA